MKIISKFLSNKKDDSNGRKKVNSSEVDQEKLVPEVGLEKLLSEILSDNENQSRRAINRLYDRFIRHNRNKMAKKGILSQEETLDAYTDAFLGAIKAIKRGTYRGDANLNTFFNSILRRKLIDRLRAKYRELKKWQKVEAMDDERPPAPEMEEEGKEDFNYMLSKEVLRENGEFTFVDMAPNQEDELIGNEIIGMALNQLKEKERKILLDKAKGYSMDEIAKRNGLKNAQVASQTCYTIRKKLIDILEKIG